MKTIYSLFRCSLFLVLYSFSIPINGQTSDPNKKIIVLDPGHGGTDSGAIGLDKTLEKEIVLQLAAQIVKTHVLQNTSTFDLYLTRYSDTLITLKDRSRLANNLQADLFISLHCNHANNTLAQGTEMYVSKRKGAYATESVLVAYRLEKALVENLGLKSRGVKFANFQVLRETNKDCPSVLIELGFLSNRTEALFFTNNNTLKVLSHVLLQTIENYLHYERTHPCYFSEH